MPAAMPFAHRLFIVRGLWLFRQTFVFVDFGMSKPKVTAIELYHEIIGEIGDPGGLIVRVHHSKDVGWLAKVYDGPTPLPESGFQIALNDIVARLRLRYDLCVYSAIPPMMPEGMRNHVRNMSQDHPERGRQWQYWKDKGTTAVSPIFDINNDLFKEAG
jgi:hypothetical protein